MIKQGGGRVRLLDFTSHRSDLQLALIEVKKRIGTVSTDLSVPSQARQNADPGLSLSPGHLEHQLVALSSLDQVNPLRLVSAIESADSL